MSSAGSAEKGDGKPSDGCIYEVGGEQRAPDVSTVTPAPAAVTFHT